MATTDKKYLDKDGLTELIKSIKSAYDNKTGDIEYSRDHRQIYTYKNISDHITDIVREDHTVSLSTRSLMSNSYNIIPELKTVLSESAVSVEHAVGEPCPIFTIPAASDSYAGLMTSNDKIKLNKLYSSVESKQEKMRVYNNNYIANTTYVIEKNSILKINGDVTGALSITFAAPDVNEYGNFAQYGLYFSTGTNVVSLSLPNNIKWANENSINIDKVSTYEIIFTTHDNGASYTATWARYEHIIDNNDNKPYFTIKFNEAGTIMMQRGGINDASGGRYQPDNEQRVQYSIRNSNGSWGNWTEMGIGVSAVSFTKGQVVRWMMNNKHNYDKRDSAGLGYRYKPGEMDGGMIVVSDTSDNYNPLHRYSGGVLWYKFVFGGTAPNVELSGNILSLMYGDDFIGKENEDLPDGAFQYMFGAEKAHSSYVASAITSVKDLILPSKYLSVGAYYAMFAGCTALKDMPKIMAETATSYSCSNMFSSCTALKDTTELKIMDFVGINGGSMCACEGMFYNCSNLKKAVIPPAPIISYGTYYQMFTECTQLEYVPDIPAVEVAASKAYGQGPFEHSYSMGKMFYNCTSLNRVDSSLKIKKPGGGCYASMFSNCTALKVAPEILAEYMTQKCYSHMFDGCISLITPPPYLPEITTTEGLNIAFHACEYMFNECTSLKSGPALRAKSPIKCMYDHMFYHCTQMTNVPYIDLSEIIPNINCNNCCRNMFYGCYFQVVEFIKHRQLNHISYTSDINNMFKDMFNRTFIKTIKFGCTITETSSPDEIYVDQSYAGATEQLNKFNDIYRNWSALSNQTTPCDVYVTRQLKGELEALWNVMFSAGGGDKNQWVDGKLFSIFGSTSAPHKIIFV